MKKIKKIKWENIFLLIFIPFDLQAILHHYMINGFYKYILLEPFIYLGITIMMSLVIKSIRKGEC